MAVAKKLLLLLLAITAGTYLLVVRGFPSEPMFDEVLFDYPTGDEAALSQPGDGKPPAVVGDALDSAFSEASSSLQREGVALAVVHRSANGDSYSLGLLNNTDHSVFVPTMNGDANYSAERLNLSTGAWEEWNVGRCGTGAAHGLHELESGSLFKFDAIVQEHDGMARSWIRFQVQIQRSGGRYPSPATIVSNPVRTRGW